ncbi:MAG: type II toxin-antitoxin system RelB/DinJ family antitoxin [Candidatus Hydrogenedentales bacterium]|jgi:DNA-damage-inducible protein J
MKTALVHARIEPKTKKKAEDILRNLGITPTEAIRIFYNQITLHGGLPFPVSIPNQRTTAALATSSKGQDIQEFDTLDAMFDSWEK